MSFKTFWILAFIFLAACLWMAYEADAACVSKGGVLIRTTFGVDCVRMERVD